MIKNFNKKRLEKLEKPSSCPSFGCVIIYDPELPIPDLPRDGKKTIILLPDNQMRENE